MDADGIEIYRKSPKAFPYVLEKTVSTQLNQILQKAIQEGTGASIRSTPLVALCLKEAQREVQFKRSMNSAYFASAASVDCEDFRDADLIDKVFKIFKRKETNLEDERKKAKKKKKVKGFFKSIFGN